ncbi:mannose-1-phosphate guanylyltransferase/mannose-6-phosphate isomerase [Gammaproteobacteria bacterium]|nr:mannose-1-phosphate guanylyltransferase/mannose-6-phosphate isomerase [Gammaproteobacteria bacterium]
MNECFNPVVMAGGAGSRLWPLSRASFPKQYQQLVDNEHGHTMLQQTFSRLSGLGLGHSQLICNQDHRFLAAEQCRAANIDAEIVLEPIGRNTAPAVILAALRLVKAGTDEPMLVLSADHVIADETSFRCALVNAHELALLGNIVTLGIKPNFACTGYGYIRYGSNVGSTASCFAVSEFVEKPDETSAKTYLEQGNYLWNSGIFIVRPSVLIKEAELYCAKLLHHCKLTIKSVTKDLDFIRLSEQDFAQCEAISLDYAIMEHTQKAVVVPVDCGWNDVGDLQALWKINNRDDEGNVLQGDVISLNSQNSLVKAGSRLVAVMGIKGLSVIETKDAVLVAPLDQAQQVKDLVAQLQGRNELEHQREVFRPWGSYDSIDSGPNYQVKRITVNPGARLSLQRHKHRAEHWVVVEGTAMVHVDGVDHQLFANDSIYIPLGAVHCLANETDSTLHLVEVQSGSYLGEDDIERLEDIYGRISN